MQTNAVSSSLTRFAHKHSVTWWELSPGRLVCWWKGYHDYEDHEIGHGTGAVVYHCRRCRAWWVLT